MRRKKEREKKRELEKNEEIFKRNILKAKLLILDYSLV